MSEHVPHFLKHFNPCADRVESIDKSLLGELDEQSTLELMDHVETCKRCRRYHGYMESVEKGFRGYSVDLHEVSPFATAGLPASMQEEIVQSMKRNLSKWMLEVIRNSIYINDLKTIFFLDHYELFPIKTTLNNTTNIIKSLNTLNISSTDTNLIEESNSHIAFLVDSNSLFDKNTVLSILDNCLILDKCNPLPYFYYDQILLSFKDYMGAIQLYDKALSNHLEPFYYSYLLNCKGIICNKIGNPKLALLLLKESIKYVNNPNTFINTGLINIQLGNIVDSICNFRRAFETTKNIHSIAIRNHTIEVFTKSIKHYYKKYSNIIDNNIELKSLLSNLIGL